MTERKPPTECPDDKAEAAGSAPASREEGAPMKRFKALTKQLLGVNSAQLKAEQEKYEAQKPKRRRAE